MVEKFARLVYGTKMVENAVKEDFAKGFSFSEAARKNGYYSLLKEQYIFELRLYLILTPIIFFGGCCSAIIFVTFVVIHSANQDINRIINFVCVSTAFSSSIFFVLADGIIEKTKNLNSMIDHIEQM